MSWQDWRALVEAYLRPHRRLAVLLGTFLLASTALQVAAPQLVRAFVDRATSHHAQPLLAIGLLYVGAVLLQQACTVVSTWAGQQLGWLTTNELRVDLMAHCLSLGPDFHKGRTPGEMIERIDGDLNGLSVFFGQFLLGLLGGLLVLVGVLIALWLQSPLAGAVLSGFSLVALGALVAVRRIGAPAWERARQASALLFGYLEERLSGTQDIRSAGAEPHVLRGFYRLARDRTRLISRARVMEAVPWATNGFIGAAANAIAFVVPALLVRRGLLSMGGAFVLYFYAQLLTQPLSNVSQQVEQLQQAIAGARRVAEIMHIQPDLADGPGTLTPDGPLGLEVRSVSFGYGDEADVLHDVTINLPPGQVLGLVGRTGSGKSSLARLLVRLYDPRQGTVEVGGVDLRQWTRADLRRRVALVSQEVHVMRATLRPNLSFFDPAAGDDDLFAALDRLGLADWALGLPDGLDTMVGAGGSGLSAGQAQLLAFARAYLGNPSVVILDEASSRLDPATEVRLESAVDYLLAGRTGVLIAHRLSTLNRCDQICVLDHGRVVEFGPRSQLAADAQSWFGRLLRSGLDLVPV